MNAIDYKSERAKILRLTATGRITASQAMYLTQALEQEIVAAYKLGRLEYYRRLGLIA